MLQHIHLFMPKLQPIQIAGPVRLRLSVVIFDHYATHMVLKCWRLAANVQILWKGSHVFPGKPTSLARCFTHLLDFSQRKCLTCMRIRRKSETVNRTAPTVPMPLQSNVQLEICQQGNNMLSTPWSAWQPTLQPNATSQNNEHPDAASSTATQMGSGKQNLRPVPFACFDIGRTVCQGAKTMLICLSHGLYQVSISFPLDHIYQAISASYGHYRPWGILWSAPPTPAGNKANIHSSDWTVCGSTSRLQSLQTGATRQP